MGEQVDSRVGQKRFWSVKRPSLAGTGLAERMRSTTFALLGLTAAAGLGLVAIFSQPGWPLLSPDPLPSSPRQGVDVGVPIANPQGPPATADGTRGGAGQAPSSAAAAPTEGSGSRLAGSVRIVAPPNPPSSTGGGTPHSQGPEAPSAEPVPAPAPAATPEPTPVAAPATGSSSSPSKSSASTSKSKEKDDGDNDHESGNGNSSDSAGHGQYKSDSSSRGPSWHHGPSTSHAPPPPPPPEPPKADPGTEAESPGLGPPHLDDGYSGHGHNHK
jgi:hypothetical protein